MEMQKHWYLGFVGLIGVYKLPGIIETFQAIGPSWHLASLAWLIWLLNFLPETKSDRQPTTKK